MDYQFSEQAVQPFVDGEMTPSQCESTLAVVNPSNGQSGVSFPAGCEADVDRAVFSARSAFEDGRWSEAAPSTRKRILHRFADLIADQAARLDALDAEDMGKPISQRFADAAESADLMRFYAEAIDKATGDVYASDEGNFVAQRHVPRGVVAAVVPWNFPTYVSALKLAPALAAGNSVILKPSELSPRSALRLAHIGLEAGLPPGAFSVVPGLGETVGRALGLHGDVDMLAFTGSTDVGKRMLQYAGQSNMKVVLAECGGKSPHIVFDDGVDLDVAAKAIATMILTNQGQICSVGSRVLVQRSIEGDLLERILGRIAKVAMGDALDPSTNFGPLASAKQCSRVMTFIETAHADGARLVAGGRRVLQETGGFFVEPTVFSSVQPNSRIAQQEIFGPVLSVIPFADEADAIRIANGTMYGLVAYVWTKDLSRGLRLAKSIRSSVRVNAAAPAGEGSGYAASHEPAGQSGIGIEGGLAGMKSYMRSQRLWFSHA